MANTMRAMKTLAEEFARLQAEPIEGFRVKLTKEDNLFEWEVGIFGPPGTLYEGGYFKAHMKFPPDYPYSPPTLRFLTKVWHPNVFKTGDLCISILHLPTKDNEGWNPTQNVRTILLSVISLLNEPNASSPANAVAASMYNNWIASKGQDKKYEDTIKKQVLESRQQAEKDNVVVPTSVEAYCVKTKPEVKQPEPVMDLFEFCDDEEVDEEGMEDGDESGSG